MIFMPVRSIMKMSSRFRTGIFMPVFTMEVMKYRISTRPVLGSATTQRRVALSSGGMYLGTHRGLQSQGFRLPHSANGGVANHGNNKRNWSNKRSCDNECNKGVAMGNELNQFNEF
jgi:hypothetical protein